MSMKPSVDGRHTMNIRYVVTLDEAEPTKREDGGSL